MHRPPTCHCTQTCTHTRTHIHTCTHTAHNPCVLTLERTCAYAHMGTQGTCTHMCTHVCMHVYTPPCPHSHTLTLLIHRHACIHTHSSSCSCTRTLTLTRDTRIHARAHTQALLSGSQIWSKVDPGAPRPWELWDAHPRGLQTVERCEARAWISPSSAPHEV